jgi:hypothetical protein
MRLSQFSAKFVIYEVVSAQYLSAPSLMHVSVDRTCFKLSCVFPVTYTNWMLFVSIRIRVHLYVVQVFVDTLQCVVTCTHVAKWYIC